MPAGCRMWLGGKEERRKSLARLILEFLSQSTDPQGRDNTESARKYEFKAND